MTQSFPMTPARTLFILAALIMTGPAVAETSHSLWRLGFYWSRTHEIYPPALVPWSMYTHVSQMAILPTTDCGIDDKWYRTGEVREDLVRVAHANDVKVMITLMQDANIKSIIKCTRPENISDFVSVLGAYVLKNGYDGIDLDWEGEVIPRQYQDLIIRLRRALPGKILTADIAMHQRGYLVQIQDQLDRINLMSYDMWRGDYRGQLLKETWHHAALLSGGDRLRRQTAESGLAYVLESGITPGKVNLAVPFYGYAFQGCELGFDTGETCGKPLSAPLQPISYQGMNKTQVEFNKIMATYGRGDVRWDDVHKTPYISYKGPNTTDCSAQSCVGNAFVTYTDERQMKETVAFLISKDLGGIMTFALHQEFMADERGLERYPLSAAINIALALEGKL